MEERLLLKQFFFFLGRFVEVEPLDKAVKEVLNLLTALPGRVWSIEELGQAVDFEPNYLFENSPAFRDLGVAMEEGNRWYWPARICDLDPRIVKLLLGNEADEIDITVLNEIGSTSLWLKNLLGEGRAGKGTTVVAKRQTEGRGSRGRSWSSPLGGLWFSTIWEFTRDLSEVASFSLVSALSIAQVLTRIAGKTEIKWPNDIMFNNKKLGGILLELGRVSGKISYVVLGVGINVNNVLADLPEEVRAGAATLSESTGRLYSLNHILAQTIRDLNLKYKVFERRGFAPFHREYLDLVCHINRPVKIQVGKQMLVGVSEGITEQGYLVLKTSGGEQKIVSSADIFL